MSMWTSRTWMVVWIGGAVILYGCSGFTGPKGIDRSRMISGTELSGLMEIALQEGVEDTMDADLSSALGIPEEEKKVKIKYLISDDRSQEFVVLNASYGGHPFIMIHHKTNFGADLEGYFYLTTEGGALISAVHAKRGKDPFQSVRLPDGKVEKFFKAEKIFWLEKYGFVQ